jgi:hypothetical protein
MSMNTFRIARIAMLASAFALTGALAAVNPELDAAMSVDGLVPLKTKDVDLAYARPGASLAAYKKIMLDPVEVAFHKDWNPERTGSRLKLSAQERENIRTGVAKVVEEEFARTLSAKGAYPIVKEAGPDVLRARVKILNLYANAPDTAVAGARTFVVSAGEMTLLLELYDSETGAILARVVDRQEGRNAGRMQVSNTVMNAGEAAQIANGWARLLKKGLDKAREAPAASAPAKGEAAKK